MNLRHLTLWLLVCAPLLAPSAVRSAEPAARGDADAAAAEPTTERPTAPREPQDTAAGGEDPADPEGPSPEVFVPSEEISEDFTVSFPVDI